MKKSKVLIVLAVMMACLMVFTACTSNTGGADASAAPAEESAAATEAVDDTAEESAAPAETADAAADTEEDVEVVVPGGATPPQFGDLTIPDGQKISIGYLAQNETDQFCVFLGEVIQDEASKYGDQVEVLMSDAQSSAATQVSQAENMAVKGVDVAIINAVDQEASAPAVDALVNAGIPVILLNTTVSNADLATSYVGIDDVEVGMMLMQMVGEALNGEGTINVVQGLLGHPANEYRWEGVQAELAESFPGITIGSAQPADWDRNKAMNVTEDWISSGADFDAVLSLNDEMAISAMNALEAAGKEGIVVVGADALDEMLELIQEGKMYGTVFQNGDAEGRAALNAAIAAVLGVEIEKEYMIPNEIVTAENVDSYIGRNTLS